MPRIAAALALAAVTLTAAFVVHADDTAKPDAPKVDAAPALTTGTVTVMPEAFTSFGACEQNGYLYMIGGHTGQPHEYDREGFNKNFYRLSLRDRTSWEILPGGVPRQSVALVSDGERLYRVGGMTALNAKGEPQKLESTLEVKAYDPLEREWTALPDLPEARSSHDAVVHEGKLYVIGGWKLAVDALEKEADEGAWHNTSLVLDPKAAKPEWKTFEQPFKTRAIALASNGKHIYVIGGMDEEGITSAVHLFDVAEGKWSKGPDLPGFAFGSSAYAANGRVYATNWEGTLYSHAAGEEAWRAEATLTFPRFFHRLVAAGNELAAIGGVGRGGQIRNIEWIKPGVKGPKVTRVTIPAPGNAKARQGIFYFNNELYVFGGNDSVEDHQFQPKNFLDEAFKINLHGLQAQRIAAAPVKRQSYQTFMLGTNDRFAEKLGYAVGGFGHNGTAAVSHADIFQYSVDADLWEPAKVKLPSPLTQFGLAQYEGRVYLFGGMDFDPARGSKKEFKESDTIWMWDPNAKDDTAKTSFVALESKLPTARRAFGGAVMGDKYYIVGGMTKDFEEVDRCDVYDFKTGEWSTIPNAGDARLSPKLIPLNGKLYLVGGSSPTLEGFKRNSSIEVFDPATGKWATVIADLGEKLGELQAFAYGHRILLYSVHNNDGEIRLLFIEP
jgi:N-acetylneuraminic acid mutarotase